MAGETEKAFSAGVDEAQVVLMAGNYRELLRALWPRLARLEWVHSMWAGLEGVLFPELVESAVPLTNSRGVFARSLGEFAIAGMLHFAKQIGPNYSGIAAFAATWAAMIVGSLLKPKSAHPSAAQPAA